MPMERRPEVCFFKMNNKVHFARPLWYNILRKSLHSSITEWARWYPPPAVQLRKDTHFSFSLRALQPRLTLFFSIRDSIPTSIPWSELSLLNGIPHNLPCTPSHFGTPPLVLVIVNPHRCFSASILHTWIPIGPPQPKFGALFYSALLQHLLCTPLLYMAALTIMALHFLLVVAPCFDLNNYCHSNTHLDLQLANTSLHLC